MKQTDSLGRSTFHHIAPQSGVTPTNREIRWLKHIERHGPQSSNYLYELTKDTHRCKDTCLRQLQKLRAGGFLMLPQQQRLVEHAGFNPYIYDLTKRAKSHLVDIGIDLPTMSPAGHWAHQYLTSCVTSSIDIAAGRAGVRYIPAHEILAITSFTLAIPVGRERLIPDQLFALDYGGCYRVFALEVDRGTEPKTSKSARKSYASSIEMYQKMIEGKFYKSHYGLRANLLVLWVFTSRANQLKFLSLVPKGPNLVTKSLLTQSMDCSKRAFSTTELMVDLYENSWERSAGRPVQICA